MIRRLLCVVSFVSALFLSACASDEELRSEATYQEAVKTSVALNEAGISSEMKRTKAGQDPRYSIYVTKANLPRAQKVLKEYNLFPSERESRDAFRTADSFIPSARETALRLDRALADEVEGALGALDGIVDVRAIIRYHLLQNAEENAGGPAAPSASVLIRYTSKSGTQPFSSDDVLSTVSKAVPGLPKESITLSATRVFLGGAELGPDSASAGMDPKGSIVPLARVNPFPFLVPATDVKRVLNMLSALLGSFALAGLFIGWQLARSRRTKGPPPKAMRTAMLEASFKGGPGDASTPVPSKRAAPSGPKGG